MLDIIIPVLNEEGILRDRKDYFTSLGHQAKIIFVDGGSRDRTVKLAKPFGEVIISARGRAKQMNCGAQASLSPNLLFLHIDTLIEINALPEVIRLLNNGCPAGCFQMNINDLNLIFRIFERLVNFRAKHFGVADGDLGLFIKRNVFHELGGFDETSIMEDIFFSRKLKKRYRLSVVPYFINVSSRLWHEKGFIQILYLYTKRYIQYWLGRIKPNG